MSPPTVTLTLLGFGLLGLSATTTLGYVGLQLGGRSVTGIKNIVLVPSSFGMFRLGRPWANLAHSSHELISQRGPSEDLRSWRYSVNFPVSTLMAEAEEYCSASRCRYDGVYPLALRRGGSGGGRSGVVWR